MDYSAPIVEPMDTIIEICNTFMISTAPHLSSYMRGAAAFCNQVSSGAGVPEPELRFGCPDDYKKQRV